MCHPVGIRDNVSSQFSCLLNAFQRQLASITTDFLAIYEVKQVYFDIEKLAFNMLLQPWSSSFNERGR